MVTAKPHVTLHLWALALECLVQETAEEGWYTIVPLQGSKTSRILHAWRRNSVWMPESVSAASKFPLILLGSVVGHSS